MSRAQPLSIASGSHDAAEDDESNTNTLNNEPPLEQKILETVKGCPKDDANQYLVKPARLCTELGLSMEDANAELCGLLAAVGGGHEGASFRFETTSSKDTSSGAVTGKVSTMVFTFPHDFDSRAKRNRQKEDFQQWCWATLQVFIKGLKIVTAFGLILSLCILVIAAMIGIIAAIVAMSTNNQRGNASQRNMLLIQLRSLFFTVRQLLWCYALFGQNIEGQDPFMSELAHDMALLMSVCCMNPGSFFWWWRVQQLNRRRRRQRRGWGRGLWGGSSSGGELESEVEGVRLIRRGSDWGQEMQQQAASSTPSEEHRGLLSIAVEYLFGPSPFHPGPSETEKWKLRAAAIVGISGKSSGDSPGVSLQQLSPYTDEPPSSLDQDVATLVAGGLQIISHFNGVPIVVNANSNESGEGYTAMKPQSARFTFPELMGESQYAARYEGPAFDEEDEQDASWGSLLCTSSSVNSLTRSPLRTGETASVPAYLLERQHKFTKLQTNQFMYCVSLGALNLIGVIWLQQSLQPPNGILQIRDGTTLATIIKGGLMPVLSFYAKLFFLLPTSRLVLIMLLNWRIKKRNGRRKQLASSTAS